MSSDIKQKNQPPEGIHITYQQQYRRCGKISCGCHDNPEQRHGPYWYAYWRDEARILHSSYVGKTPPAQFTTIPTKSVEPEDGFSGLDLELALL